MKRVCVLMSTFNGEKYIAQQIESIINQRDVSVNLVIRDDGSSDSTISILSELSKRNKNVLFYTGRNLGFEHSFMDTCPKCLDADYYAFSDQDDVWELNRLSNAIQMIQKRSNGVPCLYGSNFYITDTNLTVKKTMQNKKQYLKMKSRMHLYGAIGDNMYACTMVWNHSFHQILCEHLPDCQISHDVWTQLLADHVGAKVIYDFTPTIYHRIHNSNTSGIANGFFERIKKGFRIYVKSSINSKSEVIKEIFTYYGAKNNQGIRNELSQITDLVMNYPSSRRKKIALIFSNCFRGKPFDRWVFNSYLVLINKY